MLKRRHCGAKNVDEQAFVLCRAIRGVGLKPYKKFERSVTPKPEHTRQTQLEHCIGTDSRIEENLDIYRRACKSAAALDKRDAMIRMWNYAQALESQYAFLVTAPLVWYEEAADEEDVERYLWERVRADDREWQDIIDGKVDPEQQALDNVIELRPKEQAA
jgi:hypothetical protein